MIKIEDCVVNNVYKVEARNCGQHAVYQGNGKFILRAVDIEEHLEVEYHYNIGDIYPNMGKFGTCKPIEDLGKFKGCNFTIDLLKAMDKG